MVPESIEQYECDVKIVLASNNKGKLKEFVQLFEQTDFEIIPQSECNVNDIEETGLTFVENAILKARHASQCTKLPVIADDSGLIVDCLKGAPGIYSARFAGEHGNAQANNEKLLSLMQDVPEAQRNAAFYCALVFLRHADDPTPVICEGVWQGVVATELHGEGGFGYDPLFYLPELRCTSAELDKQEKNRLSHRGQAMQKLFERLNNIEIS